MRTCPRRLMPATIGLGAFTFTMSVMPGTPSINNAIPMPYFGTTAFAAPGIGLIASALIFVLGMWWLRRAENKARNAGEGYKPRAGQPDRGGDAAPEVNEKVRVQATAAGDFDPAELTHAERAASEPSFGLAVLPLAVVIFVNFLMSLVVLPRLDFSFLADEAWGGITFRDVAGVWSVVLALAAGCLTVIIINWRRLPDVRQSLDAGAIASVLPLLTVSSLVGFGAVVGALPAFATVTEAVLSIERPARSSSCGRRALAPGFDRQDHRDEHGGDDPGGEAVVVQVEAGMHRTDVCAADEWMNPATRPQCQPKRPAIGASVVPNNAASSSDGSSAPHGFANVPRKTPAMIGTRFLGCLPNAAKPTIVRIAPMTGPFSSPPTART